MSYRSRMKQTVTVKRKSTTGYPPVDTWSDVYSGPCRLSSVTAADIRRTEGMATVIDAVLYMLPGVDVLDTDRVEVGGKLYEIIHVDDPEGMEKMFVIGVKRA